MLSYTWYLLDSAVVASLILSQELEEGSQILYPISTQSHLKLQETSQHVAHWILLLCFVIGLEESAGSTASLKQDVNCLIKSAASIASRKTKLQGSTATNRPPAVVRVLSWI